ncbi:Uma2 family endonuclease [Terriglobus sp. RCC_193]|uniref:Uma2 family endonuclease n=1 Tax=Terriglobus sp. RCC_193 TaxID=3239218 RepID=UPI0035257BDF
MATAAHIPVSEYLHTVYRPDCDYVDGEVEERNLGEQKHGLVQTAIAAIFFANRKAWGLRPITEQRIQVTASRYRVPDVCVVSSSDPIEPILSIAPVLCVEVLSPEDRFQRIIVRAQEFQRMGVSNIWIIDPETREAWTMDSNGGAVPMMEDAFTIPGTPVRVDIADIFEEIDNAPKADNAPKT